MLAQLPLFRRLEPAQRILLAGAGGGFDIFCGLPLYFALRQQGKAVFLANFSFSNPAAVPGPRLTPAVTTITADTFGPDYYFPEKHLARWFRTQGEEVEIYAFQPSGVVPLREAYRAITTQHQLDAVVLIDGGTDSLMRGDEAGLGTPCEDIASIAAVEQLAVPMKLLVCLGFGIDAYHGVCHAHFLEAVADLSRQRAFLGAFSLLAEMPEAQRYQAACEAVFAAMPNDPSIVNASILSALEGYYGNYHRTARTRGSRLWINPLMTLYWAFELEPVARRILYLEAMKRTLTMRDLQAVVRDFRIGCQIRQREAIPV
jgi:hypothetical protein